MQHFVDRGPIGLATSHIQIADFPACIENQRGWTSDVDGIDPDRLVYAVLLCDGTVLVQQKRKRDGVLFEKLFRLEQSVTFFRGNKHERSVASDLFFLRLKLSHA